GGEGFVLYQAPKREITAVSVAPDGTIFAAGVGNKPAPGPPPPPPPASTTASNATRAGTREIAPPPPSTAVAPAITGGSEIYRIQSDGYPRRVWSHATDLIYALGFDSQ